jgi:hypothetical protein
VAVQPSDGKLARVQRVYQHTQIGL